MAQASGIEWHLLACRAAMNKIAENPIKYLEKKKNKNSELRTLNVRALSCPTTICNDWINIHPAQTTHNHILTVLSIDHSRVSRIYPQQLPMNDNQLTRRRRSLRPWSFIFGVKEIPAAMLINPDLKNLYSRTNLYTNTTGRFKLPDNIMGNTTPDCCLWI